MPEVNRYSQMIQPLIINPVSFEEFARLPIARAEAKASAYNALDRIKTEFNVGDADLEKVNQLVGEIDSSKESLIDEINNNGLSSRTVNEVLKLKRNRDDLYKNKIRQAEENKILQFNFENDIRKMYATVDPSYGDLIIQRNREGWKGTFTGDEKAPTQVFTGNMGAKYFDRYSDIYLRLAEAAKHSDVTGTPTGGGDPKVEQETLENGQIATFSVIPASGNKLYETNKAQLMASKDAIIAQYNDPTSERGKFIEYLAKDNPEHKKELLQSIEDYANQTVKELLETKDIRTQNSPKIKQLTGLKDGVNANPNYEPAGYVQTEFARDENLFAFNTSASANLGKRVENVGKVKNVPFQALSVGIAGIITQFFRDPYSVNISDLDVTEQQALLTAHSPVLKFLATTKGNRSHPDYDPKFETAYNLSTKRLPGESPQALEKYIKKYAPTLLKYASEYQEERLKQQSPVNLITEQFDQVGDGGFSIKGKATSKEMSDDLFRAAVPLLNFKTGDLVDTEDDSEEYKTVRTALANDRVKYRGTVPKYSNSLVRNGKYMSGFANSIVYEVLDDKGNVTGNEYMQPAKYGDRDSFLGKQNEAKHSLVMNLAPGQSTPNGALVYIDPVTNKQYEAEVYFNPLTEIRELHIPGLWGDNKKYEDISLSTNEYNVFARKY